MRPSIQIQDLGVLDYQKSLATQQALHHEIANGLQCPTVLMLQHPAVVTLGKNSSTSHVKKVDSLIPIVRTERGGEVTAHELGQLVVYPIFPLPSLGFTVRSYVCFLEQMVIDLLSEFGISAHRDAQYPGVWVGDKKICSLGIRIKNRVSLHGFALNVCNDLKIFDSIVPCGIQDRKMTSMVRVLSTKISVKEVAHMTRKILSRSMDVDAYNASCFLVNAEGGVTMEENQGSVLSSCCQETIQNHASRNPMLLCHDCRRLIKCFLDQASFKNYVTFCRSRGRTLELGALDPYWIVIFQNYQPLSSVGPIY